MENYKNIHIGKFIKERVSEREIDSDRICNFINCTVQEAEQMFKHKSLDADLLLRWSKLLEYDFFRIYTQHLILYAPPASQQYKSNPKSEGAGLPQFRKNIYTSEIIAFILEMIKSGEKTKNQVIEQYGIPKTTLYKWISKHK